MRFGTHFAGRWEGWGGGGGGGGAAFSRVFERILLAAPCGFARVLHCPKP